jgi:uncharacterized protein (TIGR03435 family)
MRAAIFFFLVSFAALAQSDTAHFEVASVKPADPAARIGNLMQGGPGTADPGRFRGTNVMLSRIVLDAFGIRTDQLIAPDWIGSTQLRFDIAANVPAGANKEQLGLMLQNLLIERFHLAFHRTQKEFPVYTLVIGPKGPKLKPAAPQSTASGMRIMASCQGDRLIANGRNAAGVAQALQSAVGERVVDKTGLTGTYDVELYFGIDRSGGGGVMNCESKDLDAPIVFEAVQQQLGLKLEKSKTELEVIVVDHLDKEPTEN